MKSHKHKGVGIIENSYAGEKSYRPVLHYSKDFKTLKGAKRFIDKRKSL